MMGIGGIENFSDLRQDGHLNKMESMLFAWPGKTKLSLQNAGSTLILSCNILVES